VAACVEELAFDLALDSLDAQRNVLNDVRARAATLLTASSIVTSFASAIAFFLTLLPAIYVVTASPEGSFSIDGARLYHELSAADASLEEAYIKLAEVIGSTRRANRPLVDRFVWSLRLGFVALILEVFLFLAALSLH
jgi:hypothetical protein